MRLLILLVLAFIAYDSVLAGTVVWHNIYEVEITEHIVNAGLANQIVKTDDGNFVIGGALGDFEFTPPKTIVLMKVDSNGQEIWTQKHTVATLRWISSISELSDGSLVVVGWSGDPGGENDVFWLLTDQNGVELDRGTYGSPGIREEATGIASLPGVKCAIAGTSNDWESMLLLIYQKSENSLVLGESKTYDYATDPTAVELFHDVICTQDETGIVLSGESIPNAVVVKTNLDGDEIWHTIIPRGDRAWIDRMVGSADGYFYGAGLTEVANSTIQDMLYCKIAPDGSVEWDTTHRATESSNYTKGYAVAMFEQCGGITIVGLDGADKGYVILVDEYGKKISSMHLFPPVGELHGIVPVDDDDFLAIAWRRQGDTLPPPYNAFEAIRVSWDRDSQLCGDVNADGLINVSDAAYIIAYVLAGGPSPCLETNADVDCTSNVGISDGVYLINFVFGGGPAPCANCQK